MPPLCPLRRGVISTRGRVLPETRQASWPRFLGMQTSRTYVSLYGRGIVGGAVGKGFPPATVSHTPLPWCGVRSASMTTTSENENQGEELFQKAQQMKQREEQGTGESGGWSPDAFALLQQSARTGHPGAQHEFGLILLHGSTSLGVEADESKALEYFQQAGEAGYANAQYNVGLMFATGRPHGTPDREQAATWYVKAADQDFAPAQCNLGLLYLDRYFESASRTNTPGQMRASELLQNAVRMLMLAGEQGMPSALFNLALIYQNVFHEPAQAIRYLTQAADHGSPHAQYNLAEMYWTGSQVPRDEALAEQYSRQAAQSQVPKAHTLLGLIHAHRSEWDEARQCFTQAAEQDDAAGHFHLSQLIRQESVPDGTSSSPLPYSPQAYAHLVEAAQRDHAWAQFSLGLAHQQNLTPASSSSEDASSQALQWIEKAAQQGLLEAQNYLASLYLYGKGGVATQPDTAAHWYQQAAEQGSAEAMVQLGLLRATSHPEESRSWLLRAAEQGDAQAQVNLGLLAWQQQKQPVAQEWFEKAAAQDHGDAFYYLGLLARSEPGAPQDRVRTHLEKAAQLGHAKAAYRLGGLYLTGDGNRGQVDRKKALTYFSRAADLGDSVAQTVLEAMNPSKAKRTRRKRSSIPPDHQVSSHPPTESSSEPDERVSPKE